MGRGMASIATIALELVNFFSADSLKIASLWHVVGKIKPSNRQLNTVVNENVMKLIEKRAAALDFTVSKFAGMLIKWWIKSGAPPISAPDAVTMQGLEAFIASAKAAYEPAAEQPAADELDRRLRRSLPSKPAFAGGETATKSKPRPKRPPGK